MVLKTLIFRLFLVTKSVTQMWQKWFCDRKLLIFLKWFCRKMSKMWQKWAFCDTNVTSVTQMWQNCVTNFWWFSGVFGRKMDDFWPFLAIFRGFLAIFGRFRAEIQVLWQCDKIFLISIEKKIYIVNRKFVSHCHKACFVRFLTRSSGRDINRLFNGRKRNV